MLRMSAAVLNPCRLRSSGEATEIAFNVRYLLDGLKAMDGERIVLPCNAPTTPAILKAAEDGSGLTYLVMPVQIRPEPCPCPIRFCSVICCAIVCVVIRVSTMDSV